MCLLHLLPLHCKNICRRSAASIFYYKIVFTWYTNQDFSFNLTNLVTTQLCTQFSVSIDFKIPSWSKTWRCWESSKKNCFQAQEWSILEELKITEVFKIRFNFYNLPSPLKLTVTSAYLNKHYMHKMDTGPLSLL